MDVWNWDDTQGERRIAEDLARQGWTRFVDADAVEKTRDPVAFCTSLFGQRPVRYQEMSIEPNASGNQRSLPKTMFAGALHNDCAQLGLPPHVQVMVCERQSAQGGGSHLLDLWPVMETIRERDPDLFRELFTVPRAFPSGHMTRYGITWSMCRGNLVCLHPTRARSGRIGLAFQHYIDDVPPVAFKCEPGEVYVNNNHRCLHGREAFTDPRRRFIRLLFWFERPMAAPSGLVEMAREGTRALSRRLAEQPKLVRLLMGVDAPDVGRSSGDGIQEAVRNLVQPSNCDTWQGPHQRNLLLQEALLCAAWQLSLADASPEALAQRMSTLIPLDA